MRALVACVISLFFVGYGHGQSMEETMQDRAGTTGDIVSNLFSRDGVAANQNALMGDGTISTLNGGTTFGAQVSCGSDAEYMTVTGSFAASGLTVNFDVDTDLDGTKESNMTVTNVHGLCSNGYVTCASPSAFSGCSYYKWVGQPLSTEEMATESEINSLYNCSCIHPSCDPNSATRLDDHLYIAGSGMVLNYNRQNPYFAVSDIVQDGAAWDFHGRVASACASPPDPALTNYFENPHTMTGDVPAEQASNDYFSTVSTAAAADDNPVTDQVCSIIRNSSLRELERDDVFYVNSLSNASVTSCGAGCARIVIGQNSDNWLWSVDGCSYYGGFADIELLRPDLITGAQLIDYRWDDRFVIDINENIVAQSGGWSKYDPEPVNCELNTNNEYSGPSIDISGNFTSPGSKKINMSAAVGDGGEYWAELRLYYDTSTTEKTIEVFGLGQGRNWMECDYDLTTGVVNCTGDGSSFLTHLSDTVDYSDVCESGTSDISVTTITRSASSIWPSGFWGIYDSTINQSDTFPTCANGLQGSFRVEDQLCCTADEEYYLMGGRRIVLGANECLYEDTVTDSCDLLDLDECTLKDHFSDGVAIVSNFTPTGNTITPQTQVITQGSCTVARTEDFFTQNFTYQCPSAPPTYTVDTSHLQEPTFTADEITITTDSSADPADGQMTMNIPEFPEDIGCAKQCRVRRTSIRSEFNTGGNETDQRDTDQTTEVFTRACEQNACPVGDGETVIEACGCLNQFAQVAAAMEVMRLAAKDMVCVE